MERVFKIEEVRWIRVLPSHLRKIAGSEQYPLGFRPHSRGMSEKELEGVTALIEDLTQGLLPTHRAKKIRELRMLKNDKKKVDTSSMTKECAFYDEFKTALKVMMTKWS